MTLTLCVYLLSGIPKNLPVLPPASPSDSCVYVGVLCCGGGWGGVRTAKGYNLVVSKRWKNLRPTELRARCSPTAGKPTPCSWGQQSTGDLQRNPVVLHQSQTSLKRYLPKYPRPPKNCCAMPEVPQRMTETLVLPSGKSYLWTQLDIVNYAKPECYVTWYVCAPPVITSSRIDYYRFIIYGNPNKIWSFQFLKVVLLLFCDRTTKKAKYKQL